MPEISNEDLKRVKLCEVASRVYYCNARAIILVLTYFHMVNRENFVYTPDRYSRNILIM